MKTIIAMIISAILWNPATVIEVNSDIVAVEMENGNIYEFYGEGFSEGDEVEIAKILDVIVDAS